MPQHPSLIAAEVIRKNSTKSTDAQSKLIRERLCPDLPEGAPVPVRFREAVNEPHRRVWHARNKKRRYGSLGPKNSWGRRIIGYRFGSPFHATKGYRSHGVAKKRILKFRKGQK